MFRYLITENARLEEEYGPVDPPANANLSECIKFLPPMHREVCKQALKLEASYKPYEFDTQDSAKSIQYSEKGELVGISFPKLVEKITEEGWADLMNITFHTFPLFTTPQELLRALIARHEIPVPPMMSPSEAAEFTNKKVRSIQSRVASLIKKWMRLWPNHFADTPELSGMLRNFIEELRENSTEPISRTNADLILQTLDSLSRFR